MSVDTQWDQKADIAVNLAQSLGSFQNLNKILMGKGIESARTELTAIGLEEDLVNAVCDGLREVGVHEDKMFRGTIVGPSPVATLGALFFVIDSLIRDSHYSYDDFSLLIIYLETVEGLESSFKEEKGSDNVDSDPRYTNFNFYLTFAISEFRRFFESKYYSKGEEFPLRYAFRFNELLRSFCDHSRIKYSDSLRVQENLNRGLLHIITMHRDPLGALVSNDGFLFMQLYEIVEGFISANAADYKGSLAFEAFLNSLESIIRVAANRFLVESTSEDNDNAKATQLKALEMGADSRLVSKEERAMFKTELEAGRLVLLENFSMQELLIDLFISTDPRIKAFRDLIANVFNKRASFRIQNYQIGRFLTLWPIKES